VLGIAFLDDEMTTGQSSYPRAVFPEKVGSYPAAAKAGGGYVWDEVLEYRVWCSPRLGADDLEEGSDYYFCFEIYEKASKFSRDYLGAKAPLALILQREYLDEPSPGKFIHIKTERITEWPVEFLSRPRRNADTIPNFLAPDAPPNRLQLLRGEAAPDE
jgi:putative acetyltransferase